MDKKKILFVCQGNICRSPSAEAVFNGLLKKAGISKQFEVDSAGTSAYHVGEQADRRMQSHAIRRDYNLTSISRQFDAHTDFDYFDYIVGMDDYNMQSLNRKARKASDLDKLHKMTDYCSDGQHNEVPDPYYGGADGFELVLDLLEDACEGFLEAIENKKI